jgi:hypothetical protein
MLKLGDITARLLFRPKEILEKDEIIKSCRYENIPAEEMSKSPRFRS